MDTPSPVFPVARHGLVLGVARIAASHGGGLLALLSLGGPSWLKRTLSLAQREWIKVAREIERLGDELPHRVIALEHCEAALKLFDPTVQISDIGPRKVPQALADMWRYWAGDLGHATKDHYAARRPSFVPS
jgi:hypothetical protein